MTSFKTELAKEMAKRGSRIAAIMCTPDVRQAHTQKAIETFKETTEGIPIRLEVSDNNRSQTFKNANEINRALGACSVDDYLLTLDDDVWFEDNGWLQSMIGVLDRNKHISVVSPCHWWSESKPPQPNDLGRKQFAEVTKPKYVPWAGMACTLLRVSNRRAATHYKHYYIDPDYCYDCWRNGEMVACVPERIFHEPCKSINANIGQSNRNELMRHDRYVFDSIWQSREDGIFQQVDEANKTRTIL